MLLGMAVQGPLTSRDRQISVKMLDGKTQACDVNVTTTVYQLMGAVKAKSGIPLDHLRLVCAGIHMTCRSESEAERLISFYGYVDAATTAQELKRPCAAKEMSLWTCSS